MKNYYEILGIRNNATLAEIKRAYREKCKQLHPDSSGDTSQSEVFNEVVNAYRVLSDAHQRNIFDESFAFRMYRKTSPGDSFDYYKWLSARQDPESRAKLIFFTLMRGREDEAVAEFKRMQMNHADFSLKDWFTREDFMDYGYILAEELVIRGEYYDAMILLEQIIKMEYSYTYFYIFFPEVIDFTVNILKKNIEGVINDELALDVFERALDLNLGKANDSFCLKKMALIYKRLGDSVTADICLRAANS